MGISMAEIPNPAQTAPAGSMSTIVFMAAVSAGAPQGMPRQIWNKGGSSTRPSSISALARRTWPVSKHSSSGLTPSALIFAAMTRRYPAVLT